MIEFPLYKISKNGLHAYQILIVGISVIVMFFLFPTLQSIVVLLLIVGVAFFIILTEKKKKPAGKIYLTSHQIKVVTDTNEFQIDLSNIDRLEIIYSGYNGKRVTGDFIPRFNKFSGIDNYIIIEKDNHKFNYKFYVDNELQENDIIELIRNWEKYGYDISNINLNI